jgi:membrane associated rhomboid family serine protease
MCCVNQNWRWWGYAFMHRSESHLYGNIIPFQAPAILVEMVHGWFPMALLWFFGALSGSLGVSIFDPESTSTVGASGVCMVMAGSWIADLLMNW